MPDAPAVPYPKALELFPTVRQSRLATFDACALEAKFDIEYREGWSGHPQARGQIFHRFAAKALEQMANMDERTIDVEDALTILRECLRQHDVEPRDVVTIPFHQIKDLRWVVVKWAHENIFDTQHLVSIEERLEMPIHYPGPNGEAIERILTGQLDALFVPEDDWAVVPDWKDTWALPRESDLSESGYFQQRVYGLLVMHRYPSINRVTLRETYVRLKDKATEGAPVREATIFRNELPDVLDEISALVERFDRAVEEGHWPLPEVPAEATAKQRKEARRAQEENLWKPSPGAHCNFCPRPAACPIFPDARVQGAIEDEAMAEEWAAQSVVAKAAIDQRDKGLRAWAGNRGPIPVKHAKDPHRVLGYREMKRTSRPKKEEVERALLEQGADLDLESLYTTTTSTRFGQFSDAGVPEEAVDADLMNALEASLDGQRSEKDADRAGGDG